ncbi:MAG TPA: carboxypeptidase regulatory-like domain-containing protein, partial [Chitinophagaceae bacterium]|nr:carboxypeptidase regulatory-like domain-containing protein [Chitinophagaceae bacterium]
MRQFYTSILLILVLSFQAAAQRNGAVKGLVYDTLAKRSVADVTITVMAKKDSSLVTFGMTDNAGRFSLDNIPAGEFRLLLTHVAYHNTSKNFTIDENNRQVDLGNLHA